ncbi:MAG: DUF1176 domain-containing protein [Caulobacter sp.]|nr:DUF1176 domain-containing protein [Caulobacter sp.]
MKFASLALALAAFLFLGAGAAQADGVETFKDWAVICDNLRACTVVGFGSDESELPAVLRLTRAAATGAPARIEIDQPDSEAVLGGKPPVLAVDGKVVLTAKAKPLSGDGGDAGGFTVVLDDVQVGPLLGAARNGAELTIRAGDKTVGRVSLAGMVAALRYADDQQKRVGTVTAMVAKGAAPASSVPAPPPVPILHPAPAVAQTGLPTKPPAAVLALAGKTDCDMAFDGGQKPDVTRLSADKVLWQIPCGGGAYNFDSLFVVVDKAGKAALAPIEGLDDGMATNAGYDPKARILSSYSKGRGIGDCGSSTDWVWTGEVFATSQGTIMPVCRGYGYDWPTAFHADVR